MKTETLQLLQPGAKLTLKPVRQAAYGFDGDALELVRIADRVGYKTPWIVCKHPKTGQPAWFKPSDFRGAIN